MANTPVDVKKSGTSVTPTDFWPDFRSQFDQFFDRFGGRGFPGWPALFDSENSRRMARSLAMSSPAVDISEDDKGYRITAELPGISVNDITVTVSGDLLSIKGEKHQEHEDKQANRHVSERMYGAFERSFTLPTGIDQDAIVAAFNNGVLTLTVPKSATARDQTRKIDVKAA